MEMLEKTAPHARDYVAQIEGDSAYKQARAEFKGRYGKLESVFAELTELSETVDKQQQRGS
jgi:hypothetical protein